uniref:WH2 domain-containing protein n=1 Tax=Octopus bimaculoides TaxID=37653 RepID=A0A0L8H5D3_OCTBM
MSAPPPPPPPCAPPPMKLGSKKQASNTSKPVDRNVFLGEIHKGTRLRKAVTNDRSAPAVGNKKASPASKYNTIGVHTHRQQHQVKDNALWRRGSQDGS